MVGVLLASFFLTEVQAQTYVFARLDGIPMNTTGWTLNGEAAVNNLIFNNNSELLLASAKTFTSGGIFFNQPINLSMCSKWRAEFDFRIFGGTGADGLAFSFLSAPPSGFVNGEGLGLPSGIDGLKVCFDTYNNCNSNTTFRMPKVEIRWGVGYNECWSQPTKDNRSGDISFIRSDPYKRAVITYDNGNITVSVNGIQMVTAFQQFNFTGYLGFTASTGSRTDNHSIRNVIIYTEMPPSEAGNALNSTCNTLSGQLGTGSTAGYTYTWSPSTGLSNPSVSNPTVQLTNTETTVLQQKYYVRTAFTANPGCSSIDSVIVQVNPLPTVGLSLPFTSVCSNIAPLTLTGGTPSGGTYSGPGVSAGIFSPAVAGSGNHTITYTFTNASGCSNAATRTIVVNALQQVLARNDVTICAGITIPLTASNAVNYQWSPNTNLSSTSGSSVMATPVTTTTYTVQATDANNCASSDQVVVSVVPPATASISYPGSPYCGNQQIPVVLTGQMGGSYTAPAGLSIHPTNGTIQLAGSTPGTYSVTYTYGNGVCTDFTQASVTILTPPSVSFNGVLPSSCFEGAPFSLTGGLPAGGIYSGPGVTAGSFNPSIAGRGNHEITYSFTNAGGCVNSATNSITVYPIEAVSIGPSVAVCSGGTIAISATRADSFTWSPATGLSTTSGAVVMASPLTTTMYTVTGYDNASGCTTAATITVSVLSAPVASIAYTGNPYCRQGTATVLQAGQTGGTYSAVAGLMIDPLTGTIDLANSNPGTYTVTYTFTNGGCSSFTTTAVTILPPPSVSFDPLSSVCLTSASFSLSGGNPLGGQYTGHGVSAGSFDPGVAGKGYHTISYTVIDGGGCMATATQTILVSPLTPVEAIADRTTCAGNVVTLTAIGAVSYEWNPGSLGGAQVAVSPLTNTMYTVTATHDDGCTSQDQVSVLVLSLPEASISYTGSPFCTVGTATVNRMGQSGGTFSSSSGLAINSSTGDINLVGSTPGIYTVTYTFSDGICAGVTSTNIEILSPPVVTLHLPAPTVCINTNAFTLTGGMPGGGVYSGTAVSGGVFTPSAAGRGQQLITYTYTSAAGCTSSATDIITVNPLIDVDAGSDITVCAGNTIILSAYNAVSYSWSPGYALSAVAGQEVMASPLTTTLYKVIGTDAAGCTSEDDVWVTVLPLPVAVIQYPLTSYCTIGTASINTVGQAGGVYSADAGLAIDPVTGEINLSSSTPGSYTVTYMFSNGSCSNEATTMVTILPPPSVSLNLPISSSCVNGTAVTLSGGSPVGGTYSGAGISAGVFTPAVAGNGVHVITYVYTNAGGCSAAATASFTVNPLVNVQAGVDATICLGSTATLTAINGLSYSWSPSQTLSSSTGSSVVASPLTTTSYTVTGMDVNGCSSSDVVTVNVLALPTASISYTGNPFCQTGRAQVNRTGQAGGTYSSTTGLIIDSVTGEINLSSSTPGSYTVTYSFSNGSCSNEATTMVTILPPPAVSLNLPISSSCVNGTAVTLSGGSPVGGTYSGAGISAGVFTPVFAGNGVHVITYVYTDAGGCTASATAIFTVNPLVNVQAGVDQTICMGATATLTAINGLSYSWSPSQTLSSSTGSSVVASPLTTTSYTVTGMDANGCSSSDVITVQVLPLPTASISYAGNPFCQSGTVPVSRVGQAGGTYSSTTGLIIDSVTGEINLSSSTPGSYTVTYTFSNGSCSNEATTMVTILPPPSVSLNLPISSSCVNGTAVTLSGGSPVGGTYSGAGISAGVFTPVVAGNGVHVITYVYTDAGGCTASATASFTVNPLVNVQAGVDATICLGSTATLTAINGVSYSWSPSQTLSSSTGSSVVASPLTTTSYTVTGMDANGCSSSDVITVQVLPLPTASISYTGNPFCQTGTAPVSRVGQAGGTYSSTTGLIINPVTGEINLSSSTPGSYTVTYSFSNGSCSNEATTMVTILPPPSVSLNLPISSSCVNGTAVTLSGGSPVGGTYSGAGISAGVFTPAVAGNGVHVITYVYTNAGGCTASATAIFTVNPLVNVQAGVDLTICMGSTATLTAINGVSYSWSPGSTLSSASGSSVVASPLTTTSYTVTGMDANGCSSSDMVTVNVLALPTASISYSGNPFCQSGTAPVSRVGQAGGTYSSTTGLIIDPVTGEINLSSSTPGSYTVTYSFSNGSCTSQVRTEVSIFSLPIVVYQPTLPGVCVQGNPFTLTGGNPTGGVYRGRGVTGDIFYPGVAGIGLHVIEYTYTNAKGCASTATASIQVVALVRGATKLVLPEVCVNASPFTLSLNNGIPPGGQFSGNGVVGDRFFPSVAGVGTHTIRYITPGVSGCAVLYTGTIQVNPKPALQVTAAQQVCEGMPVVINAQATGDLFWSDSTSTSLQNFVGSLTLRATRTTTYLITCRDGKGCSNVQPITIEVAGFPDANFRLDRQDFCNDGRAQVLVNGLSGGSFTASSGLAMNQSTGEINLSATQPGSYTITYQVTNQAGCQSSSSRSIQIRERSLLSLSNLILCVGTAQSITTTATLGGNSRWQSNQSDIVSVDAMGVVTGLRAGRTSVLFTNQAGCTTGLSVTVKDIPQITGRNIVCKNDSIRLTIATAGGVAGQFSSLFQSIVSVNNNGWVKGLQSGTAIIRYRDVDGCVATYPLEVDEVQERIAGPIIGCEPGTVRLDRTLQAAYGMSGYTFTFWRDAAQTGLLSNPLRIATSGIYYAQVINGNGCKLERPVELRVTIAKALQPKRLDTVKTQNNTAVQLQGRANGTSYLWSPSEGLNAVNVPNPWFRYNKNMEYRVTMQTDSGCVVTDTVFVKALDANVFVPTAFTPNRDGLNDKLTPVCYSIQRLSYFTIFNRWGEVVFTTNAIGKGWDGIAKGSPADPGTYVWMLEAIGLDGQVFRQKGTVVLIR